MFVAGNGIPDGGNLIARDIPSKVLSVFSGLEFVKRTGGTFFNNRELSTLHGLNLGDLLEDSVQWILSIHGL